MSDTVSHTDNVKNLASGIAGFAPTGLEWREMQATHVGGRLSTKMDRGGGEKLVSTRWRPKCICASVFAH